MKTLRASRLLEVAIAIMMTALLVLTAFIGLVIAYPRAGKAMTTRLLFGHPEAVILAQEVRDGVDAVSERAREGFDYRVARPLAMLSDEESAEATPSAGDAAVSETSCVPCHHDYREKRRFGDIYFDHAAHSPQLTCGSCHVATGPRRDTSPPMQRCTQCHQDADGEDCDHCHAPGTVFHGARLAGDRETAEKCTVCHPPSLLSSASAHRMPPLTERSCERCHEDVFCARCHPASHGKGYARLHPRDMRLRVVSPSQCWSCHDAGWCAMTCHDNRPASRREVTNS